MGRSNYRNNSSGGRGRGNRSGRGSAGVSVGQNTNKDRKTLKDHVFSIGTVQHASEYVATRRFLIDHIKKDFKEGKLIGEYLEDGTEPDFQKLEPSLPTSKETDAAKQAFEQDMCWKITLDPTEMSLGKAYLLLLPAAIDTTASILLCLSTRRV